MIVPKVRDRVQALDIYCSLLKRLNYAKGSKEKLVNKYNSEIEGFKQNLTEEDSKNKDLRKVVGSTLVVTGFGSNRYVIKDVESSESVDFMVKPPKCEVMSGNVLNINWLKMRKTIATKVNNGSLFDALIVDPPWKFASENPSRGAATKYEKLTDGEILSIPLGDIVVHGFIFVWTIPSRDDLVLRWIKNQGFKYVDRITWVKMNEKQLVVSSIGHHFSKSKEEVIVAKRGMYHQMLKTVNFGRDVLMELRNRQSEKPSKLHEMIENNYRSGARLGELFARSNNVRSGWWSFGLELQESWESTWLKERKAEFMLEDI